MPISVFQSTLSLRRATPVEDDPVSVRAIAIHALLAESDAFAPLGAVFLDISIHALLAESDAFSPLGALFLDISIHALLAESDQAFLPLISSSRYFNPRSPCGERQL